MSFADAVRAVVRDLGRGEVVSYGEVARRAGYPRAARAVGNVLSVSMGLPWWRVVRADGELAAHSGDEQARRLRREGITIRDGRVRGGRFSWTPAVAGSGPVKEASSVVTTPSMKGMEGRPGLGRLTPGT